MTPASPVLTPGGLTLLDVLLASLAKNPQLIIQQYDVEIQRGAVQTARGQFDWMINAGGTHTRAYTPLTDEQIVAYNVYGDPNFPTAVLGNTSQWYVSGAKQLRDGIVLQPSLESTRVADNATNLTGVSTSHVGLQITLPVLRNHGRAAVDAQEISAQKLLDATRYDLSQSVSDTLATAANRYWEFVAADATLALYKAAEDRGRDILSGTDELVKADRLPANELNQVRANLANRIASRTAAEQDLVMARQQLVLVMGLPPQQVLTLAAPAQNIPDNVARFDVTQMEGLLQLTARSRADILAARLRAESNGALQTAAQNQVKPQLDVTGGVGYSGLSEGAGFVRLPASIGGSPRGADLTVGLAYSFPPANNAAKGKLTSAVATSRQSQLVLIETQRVASTAAVVAANATQKTQFQLEQARQSVMFYQAALDSEREKYRLGRSSLVDVLTLEDRLTVSVGEEVRARLAYAESLVNLRQATGTIVPAGQLVQRIDPALFATLPDVTAAAKP